MEGKPSERELWEVTRMSRPALEAVIEQSLMLEPWKVVVAYCEHQRRGGAVPPRIANSFMVLVKDKGYEDVAQFVGDTMNGMGYGSYVELLSKVNSMEDSRGGVQRGTPQTEPPTERLIPIQSTIAPARMHNSPEPWYNQTWLVVLLCIAFFPIGLYALWKNENVSKGWKYGVYSIFGVALIAVLGREKGDQEVIQENSNEVINSKDCSEVSSLAAVKERIESIGGYYVGLWGAGHEANGCVHVWYISLIDRSGSARTGIITTDGSSGDVQITNARIGSL